jgi:hypothetical protein
MVEIPKPSSKILNIYLNKKLTRVKTPNNSNYRTCLFVQLESTKDFQLGAAILMKGKAGPENDTFGVIKSVLPESSALEIRFKYETVLGEYESLLQL